MKHIDPIYGTYVEEMRKVIKDFCKRELSDNGHIAHAIFKLESELNEEMVKANGPTSLHSDIISITQAIDKATQGETKTSEKDTYIDKIAGSLIERFVSRALNAKHYPHEREPFGTNTFPDYRFDIGGATLLVDCKSVKLDHRATGKKNKNVFTFQVKAAASNEQELCEGLNRKSKIRSALAIIVFYDCDTFEMISVKILPMMYLYQVSNKCGSWRLGIKSRGGNKGIKNSKVLLYLTTFVSENKYIISYDDQRDHVMKAVYLYLSKYKTT